MMQLLSLWQSGPVAEVHIRRRPAAPHGSVVVNADLELPAQFLASLWGRMSPRTWVAFERPADSSRPFYVDDVEMKGSLSSHWNGSCMHYTDTEALDHSLDWLEEVAHQNGVVLV
jgi:hypothetical protein